jgi:DNA-binding Lrp family transcriptional regulator
MSFRLFPVVFKHFDLFVTTWAGNVSFGAAFSPAQPRKKRRNTASAQRNPQFTPRKRMENVKFLHPTSPSAERMDEKDRQIIKILKDDARAGYGDIGSKVDLSEGAVRKRIKTLTDENIIRKFTVKIGLAEGAQAITLLATNPAYPTQEVSKKIQATPNVETIYEVTGEYDIVAVISGMNVTEVNECIEKIRRVEGIMKTNTMIVLRSW